jgi:hypothetical protein
MLKIDYSTLNKKVSDYDSMSISGKYSMSNRIFNTLINADREKVKEVLLNSGMNDLYSRAESLVFASVKKGMNIVADSNKREITLIFKDEKKDQQASFFEIENLVSKMTSDNLERLIVLGFFMNEEKMITIQSYNLISSEISGIINE